MRKLIALFLLLAVAASFAADCYCSSCTDCMAKMSDASCTSVILTADINSSGNCIENPTKLLDCQNHVIRRSGGSGSAYGIYINRNVSANVRNCRITGYTDGMLIMYSVRNTFSNIRAYNNTNFGISMRWGSSNNSFSTIYTYNNANGGIDLFYNCKYNSFSGIYSYSNPCNDTGTACQKADVGLSYYSTRNAFSNVQTYGTYYGVKLDADSDYNSFSGLDMSGARFALHIGFSDSNTVTGSSIRRNAAGGILLYQTYNNTFSGNSVVGQVNGVQISYSYNSTFNGNTICNNSQYDIWIDSGSGNTGDNNYCDPPKNQVLFPPNWNDIGTTGCTYSCSPSCTNECSLGQTGCGVYISPAPAPTSRWYCGQNDADSCLDKIYITCPSGQYCYSGTCRLPCGNGICEPLAGETSSTCPADCPVSCTDQCSYSGQTQCNGTQIQTCGNYDADSCLEWSATASCPSGQTCSGGACTPIASNCTCNSCADCEAKLNNPGCQIVLLAQNIGTLQGCINNPVNFTNKVFDCQNHLISGPTTCLTNYACFTGIALSGKQNNAIRNCAFSGFRDAIRLEGTANISLLSMNFTSNDASSVTVQNSRQTAITGIRGVGVGSGVRCTNSNQTTISNLYAESAKYGSADIQYCRNTSIYNVTVLYGGISGVGTIAGLSVFASNNTVISGVNITGHAYYSLTFSDSINNSISNVVARNGYHGLLLARINNSRISNCTSSGHSSLAFYIGDSRNGTFTDLRISGSDGLQIINVNNNSFSGARAENNSGYGLAFASSGGNSISNSYSCSNVLGGYYFSSNSSGNSGSGNIGNTTNTAGNPQFSYSLCAGACTDECAAGQTACVNSFQRWYCGQADADACLERIYQNCTTGLTTCLNGNCSTYCGNLVCEANENCSSCPYDCGYCPSACGDGKCTGNETCASCQQDCGICAPALSLSFVYPTPSSGYSTMQTSALINVSATRSLNYVILDFAPAGNSINYSSMASGTSKSFTMSGLQPGPYSYRAYGCDVFNNCSNTERRNLTVLGDSRAPWITLLAPAQSYSSSNPSVAFGFRATDDQSSLMDCTLSIDASAWARNNSVANNTATYFTSSSFTINTGHYWNVSCTDASNNSNVSETRAFTITDSSPAVSLLSPSHQYASSTGQINFGWSATDAESSALSCTFYINGSLVQSYPSYARNTVINYSANLGEGNYNWAVTCYDARGNVATSTRTFTISVPCDASAPTVELQFPENNLITMAHTLEAGWAAYDDSANVTCTALLYRNGENIFARTQKGASGSLMHDVFPTLSEGTYWWNVTCLDECCNAGTSGTRTFTIINESGNCTRPFDLFMISPDRGALLTYANPAFVYRPEDGNGDDITTTINIFGPATGITDTRPSDNNVDNYYGPVNLREGVFSWNLSSRDEFGCAARSESWFFFITGNCSGNTPPAVALSVNQTLVKTSGGNSILLAWTARDNEPADGICFVDEMSCSFFLNEQIIYSKSDVHSGTSELYTLSGLAPGTYLLQVRCTDYEGGSASSNPVYITIIQDTNPSDTIAPAISLQSPPDGYQSREHTLQTSWVATDNADNVLECNVHVASNGQPVYDSGTLNCANGATCPHNLPTLNYCGRYSWNVSCVDNGDPVGWSPDWEFVITTDQYGRECGNQPPQITLISPVCYQAINFLPADFVWIATDDYSSSLSCALLIDGQQMGIYTVQNGVQYTAQQPTIAEGLHSWGVNCSDGELTAYASDYFIYNPDAQECDSSIEASLISPPDGAVINTDSANLRWIAYDSAFENLSCGLVYDGAVALSQMPVSNGTPVSHLLQNIAQGTHNWSAVCWDQCSSGIAPSCPLLCSGNCSNQNVSPTWNFTYNSSARVILEYDPLSDISNACENAPFSIPVTLRNIGGAASFGITQNLSCAGLPCSLFPTDSFDLIQGGSASFELAIDAPATPRSEFVSISAIDIAGNSAGEGFVITSINATDCDPGNRGNRTDIFGNLTPVSRNLSIYIDAPLEALCGETVQVNVTYENGVPVSGMPLVVIWPLGSEQVLLDASGHADYVGQDEGFYTYDVPGMVIRRTSVTYVYCPNSTLGIKTLIVPLYVTEDSKLDLSVFREGKKPQKAALKILRPSQAINFTNTTTFGTYEEIITLKGKYVFTISASSVKALSAKLELNRVPGGAGLPAEAGFLLLLLLIAIAAAVGYHSRRTIIAMLAKKKLVLMKKEKEDYGAGEPIALSFTVKDLKAGVSNAAVTVISETGEETTLATDKKGRIIFIPEKEGTYHVSIAEHIIYGDDRIIVRKPGEGGEKARQEGKKGKKHSVE